MPSPELESSSTVPPVVVSQIPQPPCPSTRSGDSPRNCFEATEQLFRRVLRRDVIGEHPMPYWLDRWPVCVNRSADSYPRCLLCERPNGRPFRYDIRKSVVIRIPVAKARNCGIRIEHKPNPLNYAHCELTLPSMTLRLDLESTRRLCAAAWKTDAKPSDAQWECSK